MAAVKRYRFHPEASEELEAADDWYFLHSIDASLEFISDVDAAIEEIVQAPRRWTNHLYGTRRYVLHRFPFSIVYLDEADFVTIIAVAHSKRRPGYWKRRL